MRKTITLATHEIAEYISWSYFFHAWGFPAKYSAVTRVHGCESCMASWVAGFEKPDEAARAAEAVKLYRDARKVLREADGQFDFHGRFGLFDANSDGDDIIVYDDDGKATRIPFLRQQYNPSPSGDCLCLADYIMPATAGGKKDKIGVFVASNDGRMEQMYADDNYRHLLYQTLSDRLAEAGTEVMHLRIRKELWGYAKDEKLSTDDIINAKYQGIRPAVGYPQMPDQSIVFILDKLIDFGEIGVSLTESGAMRPHSSTCGLMFAHPQARYFNIGKIGADQFDDYTRRRGLPKSRMRDFLWANLVS